MYSVLFSFLLAMLVRSASGQRSRIQLAFGIMTYQREDRTVEETYAEFLRLMVNIYESEENHLYVLHTDIKSDPGLLEAINNDYCAPKRNCKPIDARNVAWGSLTTAEMMLALMRKADNFFDSPDEGTNGKHWDYFILLGHESFPLTTLRYTENFLASYPSGINFINCWPIAGYNFFGQWESNSWRLTEVVVDNFEGSLVDVPQTHRTAPTRFQKIYKSLQHVVLSREFVRYACYGDNTALLMIYLSNVRTSDEMLFPTLLQSHEHFASTAICNTTLHYSHWIRPGGSWHPEYLDLEHLPVLMQHAGIDALYARKMNLYTSDVLVWAIDKIREDMLNERILHDRLLYLGASSPTTSPTLPPATSFIANSPTSAPTKSPGIYVPNDFVSNMTWLVPVAVRHFKAVVADPSTPSTVKVIIEETGLLERSRSGHDLTSMHPYAVLHTLDAIRRARDRLGAKKFVDEAFGGDIESLIPPGAPRELYDGIMNVTGAQSVAHQENKEEIQDNSAVSEPNVEDPRVKPMNRVRSVVRKGLSSSTVRFKDAEITFDRIKSFDESKETKH